MAKCIIKGMFTRPIKRKVETTIIKDGKKVKGYKSEWMVVHYNPAVPSNHRMLY